MTRAPTLLDRHVLASNPSTIDRGMRSFGWTQALAGARADAVFRRAPWGEPPSVGADVASWTGAPSSAADGILARMESAFLPLDDRLAFSVWGAFGAQPRRTLTHTILFDDEAFFALAGNPYVLYQDATPAWLADLMGGAAFVEPGEIAPIALAFTPSLRAAAEAARLEHAFRLRGRLRETYSADDLETLLAAIFDRLGAREPVALIAGDADHRAIIRLAWLSLPIEERITRFFCTEQTKAGPPIADLVAVAGAGQQAVSELVARGRVAGAGRRYWASVVARAELRAWTNAEVDLRASKSFSIVNGDSITPYVMFRQLEQEAAASGPAGPRAERLFAQLAQNPTHGLDGGRLGELIATLLRGDDTPFPDTARQVWRSLKLCPAANTAGAIATAADLLAKGNGVAQLHALLLACAQATEETSPALERLARTSGPVLAANPVAIPAFIRALGARATAGERAFAERAIGELPPEVIARIDVGDVARSGVVDLTTDGGGRWTAALISTLAGAGSDCWPDVHPWILAAGTRAHATVRDLLARPDFLERALHEGWEPRDADYFAIAAPEPTRLFSAVRTWYGEPHAAARVRQAIARLAKDGRLAGALRAFADDDDPAGTLALLADPGWPAAVAGAPDFGAARGETIGAALAKLAHRSELHAVSDDNLAACIGLLSPVQARKLGEAQVRSLESRKAMVADDRRLLWAAVPFALADTDAAAGMLIERVLTLFPPRDNGDAWRALLDATDATLLARDRALDRLSAAMVELDDGDVAAALLERVAPIVAANPTAGQVESILRLCWRAPARALGVIEAVADPSSVVRLYTKLIVNRPPPALFIAVLERLSAATAGKRREMLAVTTPDELRSIAPTLAAELDERAVRPRVAFVPAGFAFRPADSAFDNSHGLTRG